MATAEDPATATVPSKRKLRLVLRRFLVRTIRSAGIAWLILTVLSGQGVELVGQLAGAHPLERFIQEADMAVDATVVTVEAVVPFHGDRVASASGHGNRIEDDFDLADAKAVLLRLVDRIAGWDDAPHRWELITEVSQQYWAMRYEGRGFLGTHWILSAHGLQGDETVNVSVRAQFVGLPTHLRPTVRRLTDVLRSNGMDGAAARVAVTGMARQDIGHRPVQYATDLLHTWGPGESTHVRQTEGGVWLSGYTPYLAASGASNIQVYVVPHGTASRVTLASPDLRGADMVAADAGVTNMILLAANGYTWAAGGQTIVHEVNGTW